MLVDTLTVLETLVVALLFCFEAQVPSALLGQLLAVCSLPGGCPCRMSKVLWLWCIGLSESRMGLVWRVYVGCFRFSAPFCFLNQVLDWTTISVRHSEQADGVDG